MKPVILEISGTAIIGGAAFLTLLVLVYLAAKAIMRWLENYRSRQDGGDGDNN
jgi:hypothetical protein